LAASPIERIRDAVLAGRYRFSGHGLDELDADRLHPIDVESALLTGTVTRTQRDEPNVPGPRYNVVGTATDLATKVAVICRFEPRRELLVITCYEIE